MIDNFSPHNNYPNEIEYFSSWTTNAYREIYRNLLGFDVFDILTNATATNTDLFHYYAANSFVANNTSLTNSNKPVLHRTTSAWSECSAT